jgi:hypothetical protein
MTTAQLIASPLKRTLVHPSPEVVDAAPRVLHEPLDDVLPVDLVVQAGPPLYAIALFGGVVALLAAAPLMILAAVLLITLAVTAVLGALVAAPVLVVRRVARRGMR